MHDSQSDRIERKVDQLISGLELKRQQDRIETKLDKLLASQAGGMTPEEVAAATAKLNAVRDNLQEIK